MKIQIKLAALFLLSFILHPSSLLGQGSLTPPGAPAPTMKTLAQIEPRTPISSVPFTISSPGAYYLTTNVTCAVSNAFVITTNNVTLDLNGFTISSSVANAANGGSAILLSSGSRNITIANGFIQSGVTNNGSGVYNGSGFGNGVSSSGLQPQNVLVSRVSVSGCRFNGIWVGTGDSTVVENCTVRTVGSDGIHAGTIKTSSAMDCGINGIAGDQVSDCRGQSTSNGGDGVLATTAQNSYGQSNNGTGVDASIALNCYGTSNTGTGVNCSNAENCYGQSTSSYGVYAYIAHNCYGLSSTSTGLEATTALNCFGVCYGSNAGLYVTGTATGSYGSSGTGTGLYAYIANACTGSSVSSAHNVNSF